MSCRKASYIIEKRWVSKISLWEKLSLKFHLMICNLCRKYESDSKILGKILKSLNKHEHSSHLSKTDKDALKDALKISE
ncbi:MAG: hypothetical protein IPM77_05295 [Crocinitomicaceae bacterium]|nr:hypothetical protein [Crocinitomicaceae bacterium]